LSRGEFVLAFTALDHQARQQLLINVGCPELLTLFCSKLPFETITAAVCLLLQVLLH
jgi:hypothetical protein